MPSAAALDHVNDLASFVAASPSSFHAAAEAARRLAEAGFTGLDERAAWDLGAGKYFVVRDGAIIAWVQPESATATTGFHILGSHTDSPSFKLKPKPTTGAYGWLQAGVEVYGGPLLNSWLDRELLLAGRLAMADGTTVLARTAPMLRFPQLAIHLDRAVNDGLALDKQAHMNPVWGIGNPDEADVLAVLAESAGVDPAQVGGYDVVIADAQRGEVFGGTNEFFASGRLDNLSSVHASLVAMIEHAATGGGEPHRPLCGLRPRGNRLRLPLGRLRPVPAGRARAHRPRTGRQHRGPQPRLCGFLLPLGRRRALGAPQLRRPP